jgi:hypothetical protein
MKKERPWEFGRELIRMTEEWERKAPTSQGVEPDIGLEKSIETLNECMAARKAQRAAEDAELAKRPDAGAIGASLQHALKASRAREEELRQELDELRRRQ